MSHSNGNYGIHCNSCHYEGPGKTNSSTAFIIFMVILCASAYFLPFIIVALVYMGWLIARPVKYKCPKCNSENCIPLTEEQAIALSETQKTPNIDESVK